MRSDARNPDQEERTVNTTIEVNGKPVAVELSRAASNAIEQRTRPLVVEMELYFSCFIRKRVLFCDGRADDERSRFPQGLSVHFRPVMARACRVADVHGAGPPLTDFPVAKPAVFVPHWLRIDYRGGRWHGEFGYR